MSLKSILLSLFGHPKAKEIKLTKADVETMEDYCRRDVEIGEELRKQFMEDNIDPRAFSSIKLVPPPGLPHISRKALKRVKDWLPPPTQCPYCRSAVKLINNSMIYNGTSYGDWPFAYRCTSCDAYVGLHNNTDLPLGTLANKELREARKKAKSCFFGALKVYGVNRDVGYQWLANLMDIPKKECHFGWFSVAQCRHAQTVIEASFQDKHLAPVPMERSEKGYMRVKEAPRKKMGKLKEIN